MATDGAGLFPGSPSTSVSGRCEYSTCGRTAPGRRWRCSTTPSSMGSTACSSTTARATRLRRTFPQTLGARADRGAGRRARAYLDGSPAPALVVDELKHGRAVGRSDSWPTEPAPCTSRTSASGPTPALDLHRRRKPQRRRPAHPVAVVAAAPAQGDQPRTPAGRAANPGPHLAGVESEPSGLVNICGGPRGRCRSRGRAGEDDDHVAAPQRARSVLATATRSASFSTVSSCSTGTVLSSGATPSSTAPSALRRGLLDLEKGANELLLMVAESFGAGIHGQLQSLAREIVALSPDVERFGPLPRSCRFPSRAFDPARGSSTCRTTFAASRRGRRPTVHLSRHGQRRDRHAALVEG